MQLLVFSCSTVFIYFNIFLAKSLIKETQDPYKLNSRLVKLLNVVKVAPVIAFFILLGLVSLYFHTKAGIRLSHAWYDSQFWAYATLFYFFYRLTKNKLSLIFAALSIFIAIYNTPLFHYEHLFNGRSMIVSDIFGILMFLSMWFAVSKITAKFRLQLKSNIA
ncbi:hypothetical protein [Neobacillus niacini]|uniref:hypothetical protein n=1 Tax=Neobacillus niacini TaxID=86668 RepID=UPI0021CB2E3C|nr:hypothetical protein [Neobacillus niacini]MCM3767591.1 hypothetical protein [Neobacillus niacini]